MPNNVRAFVYAALVYIVLLSVMFGSWSLFAPTPEPQLEAVRVNFVKPAANNTQPDKPNNIKPKSKKALQKLQRKVPVEKPETVQEKPPKKPVPKEVTALPIERKPNTPEMKKEVTPLKPQSKKQPIKESDKEKSIAEDVKQQLEKKAEKETKTVAHKPKKTNFDDIDEFEEEEFETFEKTETITAEITPKKEVVVNVPAAQEDESAEFSQEQIAVKEAAIAHIKSAIELAWVRPASARNDMSVEVIVRLLADGKIMRKDLEKSSGNAAFDQSVLAALDKLEYLPVPDDAAIFKEYFRDLLFKFSPDDL